MDVKRLAASLLITGGLIFCPQTVPFSSVYTASAAYDASTADESLWEYKVIESANDISSEPYAMLTKFKGKAEDGAWEMYVPKTIGGYPVLELDDSIFKIAETGDYIHLCIPDTVKNVYGSLDNNASLFTITTESGMNYSYWSGGDMCLVSTSDAKDVYIPDKLLGVPVTEFFSAGINLDTVETLRLSDYFTSLPDFENRATKIKKINIPKAVKVIPSGAFRSRNYPELEEVEFHDGINLIARDAFNGTDIVPPQDKVANNVDEIKIGSLSYTDADDETGWCYTINIDREGKPIDAYIRYAPDLQGAAPSTYKGLPVTDLRLTDDFPDNMKYMIIREGTKSTINFHNNTTEVLERVDIRSTDVDIDRGLFKYASIEKLFFPGAVDIGFQAAYKCTKLEEVKFSGNDKVINVGAEAFYGDTALKEIIFPETVGKFTVGEKAFYQSGLEEMVIPENTDSVGVSAFAENEKLKKVTINGSPVIKNSAFSDCPSLEEVVINGTPQMEERVFSENKALKNIKLDITKPFNSRTVNNCPELSMINGEKVFNNDGSPVEKYRSFIEKNFNDSDDNYIVNNYVMYRIRETVKEVITDDMSDVEKIKVLHDKVCSMVDYDLEDTENEKNHVDVSIFLNDLSVCEGYARAYHLLLHEAGIESYYVCTDDHAWDVVRIGDSYFHIDTAWDDGEETQYDWFLLTDSQIDKDPTHSGFRMRSPSSLHDFQGSELPECRYRIGDVNHDNVIDAVDASAVLKSYARASMGEKMTVDSGLGDFNLNGVVDAVDASAILADYAKRSLD